MRRILMLVTALAMALAMAPAADTAVVDAEFTLAPGESATFEGQVGGVNPLYYNLPQAGMGGHGTCAKTPDMYCEHVLVTLVNPVADDGDDATDLTSDAYFDATLATDAGDYDIILYASDADGTIGDELGSSASYPLGDFGEAVSTVITTSESSDTVYLLLRIVHYAPVDNPTVDLSLTPSIF